MRRGQTDSLSLLTSMIIALLIIISLTFISCNIVNQQLDVRSRVNFDRAVEYLTQCKQLGQTDCYCDPPALFENSNSAESLLLESQSNGLYLKLEKDGEIYQNKQVHDKSFCIYSYSSTDQRWSATLQSTYNLLDLPGTKYFIAYLPKNGDLCFLKGFSPNIQHYPQNYRIAPEVAYQLRSCSTPPSSLTIFLQQRHDPKTLDIAKTNRIADIFLNILQQTFIPKGGTVFVSHVRPQGIIFTDMVDDTQTVFSTFAQRINNDFSKPLVLISPKITLSDQVFLNNKENKKEDKIVLSYLANSPSSAALAQQVRERLLSLSGKSYKDEFLLSEQDSSFKDLTFSFSVDLKPLLDSDTSLNELIYFQPWFKQQYPKLFEQRTQMPTLFIDFIDLNNDLSLFPNHYFALSQVIALATQDYLQQQPVMTPENIFDQP